MDTTIDQLKVTVQRLRLQLMRFQWLHEETLTGVGALQSGSAPRTSLMSDLKKVYITTVTTTTTTTTTNV